jgi:hypothetical protein
MDPVTMVLMPCSTPGPNITLAVIEMQHNNGSLSGTLSYAGMVRAFLTFDDTGSRILGYTLVAGDNVTQQSVANILAAF